MPKTQIKSFLPVSYTRIEAQLEKNEPMLPKYHGDGGRSEIQNSCKTWVGKSEDMPSLTNLFFFYKNKIK